MEMKEPFQWASESFILATMAAGVGTTLFWLAATRDTPSYLLLREIAAGGTAAACAEFLLYPIEVFKVKRQTRTKIVLSELIWRRPGVVAGTARALLYHGLRLGIFPAVKRALPGASLADKLLVGAACGALGSALCNPLDLAKTRLQRDGQRYSNSLHALATIPREEKGGLWVGAPASVARAAAGSAAQLTSYDLVKTSQSPSAVLLATVVSSVAYVTAAAPFDVVKARLMVSSKKERKNLIACLVDIVRYEGPLALFRGWLPALLRLLPSTLLIFPLLERLRVLVGAGAF